MKEESHMFGSLTGAMQDARAWPGFSYCSASVAGIAERASAAETPDYARLPRRAWIVILQSLDAQSRLSVAALGKKFEALNYSERAMRTIRCGAVNGMVALTRSLMCERSKHVRVLCLTNCFLADPIHLLNSVAMCEHLVELLCVGCPLDARQLFRLVAQRLRKLERLEFSLFCNKPSRGKRANSTFSPAEASEARTLSLQHVYVEVRCALHSCFELLFPYLRQCPKMSQLHVHTVRGAHDFLVPRCALLATSAPNSLHVFTYTTDEDVQEMCRQFKGVPKSHQLIVTMISLCGNTTIYLQALQPSSANDGRGRLYFGPVHVQRIKHVILTVHATTATGSKLKQLAEAASWSHVRSLAVVSSPKAVDVLPNLPVTCAPPEFKDALISLFQAFRAITELNLNAFHFSEDLSLSGIAELSGLSRLRALSLTPCALRGSRYSMEQLGFACPRLEELDVRSNLIGDPAFPCLSCHSEEPFTFSQQGLVVAYWLASLVGASGLETLTLYKVPGLYSFSFLAVCRVTELRLSGVATTSVDEFIGLGARLCANPNLSKLTIEHPELPIATPRLWTELSKVKSLHFLCLLSESKAWQKAVVIGAETLQHAVPLLEGLHVHFQEPNRTAKNSITRLRTTPKSLSRNVTQAGDFVTLVRKPCVQCSMSTFVGLHKPRHSGWYNF